MKSRFLFQVGNHETSLLGGIELGHIHESVDFLGNNPPPSGSLKQKTQGT